MKVVISSGHGLKIRGAAGPPPWGLDEVDEARRVVEQTATVLRQLNVGVATFHDDVSTSQNENLERIVSFHNSQTRDIDISVHLNAYEPTTGGRGCEVLYTSNAGLEIADEIVDAICEASGLTNRGPKQRSDLYFLNNTEMPAALIETCFCDAHVDCDIYRNNFNAICNAIAEAISGQEISPAPDPDVLFSASGTCSTFGGPEDEGVSPSEGLAFIQDIHTKPMLFLPYQPTGTTGLARRLNPWVHYIACRWVYDDTPKEMLRGEQVALVRAKRTGIELTAIPADWGPRAGRAADLSPSLMMDLGIETDDEVEVIYPYRENA